MRKMTKRFASLVLALVCLLILLPGGVLAETSENYTYTVDSSGNATITKYTGTDAIVTIPSTLGGCPVTSIGSRAFLGSKTLTSVTIPEGVTSIGQSAFNICRVLTGVTIPSTVTKIGSSAFASCESLASITIPAAVTSIGTSAFENCRSLPAINVASANANYCSVDGVLFSKDRKQLLAYPAGKQNASYTIPSTVTLVSSCAFMGCASLTSVTIPDSVTKIGSYIFSGSGVTSVTVPASAEIGNAAFCRAASLTAINVASNHPDYCSKEGVLFNKEKTKLIQYPAGREGSSYTIPAGVTAIGDGAFEDCVNLTDLTIPDAVTSVGSSAFMQSSLRSITIPTGVTVIRQEAFNCCANLISVTLPSGLTTIETRAFEGCDSLTDIEIPASVTEIQSYAFAECISLTDAVIPSGISAISEGTFYHCFSLTSVTIPASVTSIGEYAFADCFQLTNIYYEGSQAGWQQIDIAEHNPELSLDQVTIHYNSSTGPSMPQITTQPKNVSVAAGSTAAFKIVATGATSYQWQYRKTPTGAWTAVAAASGKTSTYKLTAEARHNGYQYRCKVTNAAGSVYSNTVTLTVSSGKPTITTQPSNVSVAVGSTAQFKVVATGATSYQWYYRTSSTGSWTAVVASSGKTSTYKLTTAARHNGYQYRCKITNSAGSVYSNTVTLTVKPKITSQPTGKTVTAGTTVHFKVTAENATSYQWYYRTSSTGTWTAVAAASGKTADYSLTTAARHNGYQYRCKVMNATSYVYTSIVTLKVS